MSFEEILYIKHNYVYFEIKNHTFLSKMGKKIFIIYNMYLIIHIAKFKSVHIIVVLYIFQRDSLLIQYKIVNTICIMNVNNGSFFHMVYSLCLSIEFQVSVEGWKITQQKQGFITEKNDPAGKSQNGIYNLF